MMKVLLNKHIIKELGKAYGDIKSGIMLVEDEFLEKKFTQYEIKKLKA